MTLKEKAKQVIDTLPDEADMNDIMHALYVQSKFDHGDQEIEQGKGMSHEEVKRKLFAKWVK
jgi:hypothetical protein